MAHLRKRRIGKNEYYYLEHSYKERGKVKVISKYLGVKKPDSINDLKKSIVFEVLRKQWLSSLLAIKKNYSKEQKTLPKSAQEKMLEQFMVGFIFNSDKIEGSSLTYKDTASLLMHGVTPKDKPVKDVKEAEGHKKAFRMMMDEKQDITLEKVLAWHNVIFQESDPIIAGKMRLHKIMVIGSRTSFPHPETLKHELKDFFAWYKNEKNK